MDAEVIFWPEGRKVKVNKGTSVLAASRKAGVVIPTRCGGNAACFLCKITLRPASEVMPMNDVEKRKLGSDKPPYRLACQVRVNGKTEVDVPLNPLKTAVAKLLAKQKDEEAQWWPEKEEDK